MKSIMYRDRDHNTTELKINPDRVIWTKERLLDEGVRVVFGFENGESIQINSCQESFNNELARDLRKFYDALRKDGGGDDL